jgi:hypothetical protein
VGERDFDFWVGEWDVSWGNGARGRNVISQLFDGNAVLEQFDGRPGIELQGASLSVYDAGGEVWRQTWVDSDRNYLVFEGTFVDGVMDLRTERGGATYRMQWRDIEPDSLRWLWQRQAGDGNWETLWELRYARSGADT